MLTLESLESNCSAKNFELEGPLSIDELCSPVMHFLSPILLLIAEHLSWCHSRAVWSCCKERCHLHIGCGSVERYCQLISCSMYKLIGCFHLQKKWCLWRKLEHENSSERSYHWSGKFYHFYIVYVRVRFLTKRTGFQCHRAIHFSVE